MTASQGQNTQTSQEIAKNWKTQNVEFHFPGEQQKIKERKKNHLSAAAELSQECEKEKPCFSWNSHLSLLIFYLIKLLKYAMLYSKSYPKLSTIEGTKFSSCETPFSDFQPVSLFESIETRTSSYPGAQLFKLRATKNQSSKIGECVLLLKM